MLCLLINTRLSKATYILCIASSTNIIFKATSCSRKTNAEIRSFLGARSLVSSTKSSADIALPRCHYWVIWFALPRAFEVNGCYSLLHQSIVLRFFLNHKDVLSCSLTRWQIRSQGCWHSLSIIGITARLFLFLMHSSPTHRVSRNLVPVCCLQWFHKHPPAK